MPGGQDKPVAILPMRVGRRVTQMPGEQRVGERGERHGRARMPGIGGLNRVHGEGADRIYGEEVEGVGSGHGPKLRLSGVRARDRA